MKRYDALRYLLLIILGFAGIALLLLLFQHAAVPVILIFVPTLETFFYDLGAFGAYRSQSFHSFNLTAPQTSIVKWEESCDHGIVFLDLNGPSVNHPGPLILDSKGQMIWTTDEYGVTINSKVQRYKGENYLTFWAGHKEGSSGRGNYYMLDSSYRQVFTVAAAGDGLHGDLHEFKITSDDTALLTVYNVTNADLTAMGMWRGENGWITDSLFQEIDIATGELLFEWRASDHFDAAESYMTNPFGGYTQSKPFDFFHLNSIEKDARGNYLISSRHLHIIAYIEGGTGKLLWVLGGHAQDFVDLSGGAASSFSWQHDARWLSEDEGIISLFDNGVAWPHVDAPYSQGLVLQLDAANRTVSLLHSYASLQHVRSSSQGSTQRISVGDSPDDAHMFIGWGSSAAFSEFALDGRLLCETHFGASALYFWERVKSYRAFKLPRHEWTATPAAWGPAAALTGSTLHASWNGATEIAFWSLQGSTSTEPDAPFEEFDVRDHHAFESSFPLTPSDPPYLRFRVAALDAHRNILGISDFVSRPPSAPTNFLRLLATLIFPCLAVFALAMVWWFRRRGRAPAWNALVARCTPSWGGYKYQKLW
nr:hypothetical protein CFP56_30970 [Quercus suber]